MLFCSSKLCDRYRDRNHRPHCDLPDHLIRTVAFTLAAFTAGIGGIVYASRLRSMSTSFDGGTIALYVVASAVIGGTSMFGGRGSPLHPVLGGIVIAGIVNGMALLGLHAAIQLMATASSSSSRS